VPPATAAIHIRSSTGTNSTYYALKDHLGSTDRITNAAGSVAVALSYDAFGKRRGSNWTGNPSSGDLSNIAATTRHGFTEHEHLDNLALIHMNGRVQDPVIGRFLSADPLVQAPDYSQSLNRYAYAWNNPLSRIDPSGFANAPTQEDADDPEARHDSAAMAWFYTVMVNGGNAPTMCMTMACSVNESLAGFQGVPPGPMYVPSAGAYWRTREDRERAEDPRPREGEVSVTNPDGTPEDLAAGLAGDIELPAQDRHLPPSSNRATNRSRSSILEHSCHGTFALPQRAEKCYLCVRNELLPFCREGHRA